MNYDKKYIPFVKWLISVGGECAVQESPYSNPCDFCPFHEPKALPCINWNKEKTLKECHDYLKHLETYRPPICKHCKFWNADEGCDKIKIGLDNFDESSINLIIDENCPSETLYTSQSREVPHYHGGRKEGIERVDNEISEVGTFADLVKEYVKVIVGENFTCPMHEFKEV